MFKLEEYGEWEGQEVVSGVCLRAFVRPTVAALQVKEAVHQLGAGGEVLRHVIQPVGVDLGDQPRLPFQVQRHTKRVVPGGVVERPSVVVQGKELKSYRQTDRQTEGDRQSEVEVEKLFSCSLM